MFLMSPSPWMRQMHSDIDFLVMRPPLFSTHSLTKSAWGLMIWWINKYIKQNFGGIQLDLPCCLVQCRPSYNQFTIQSCKNTTTLTETSATLRMKRWVIVGFSRSECLRSCTVSSVTYKNVRVQLDGLLGPKWSYPGDKEGRRSAGPRCPGLGGWASVWPEAEQCGPRAEQEGGGSNRHGEGARQGSRDLGAVHTEHHLPWHEVHLPGL